MRNYFFPRIRKSVLRTRIRGPLNFLFNHRYSSTSEQKLKNLPTKKCYVFHTFKYFFVFDNIISTRISSLGRYVFGSEISYNKPPPRLPELAY